LLEGCAKGFQRASLTPAVPEVVADCEGTLKAVDGVLEPPQGVVGVAEALEGERFTPAVARRVLATNRVVREGPGSTRSNMWIA
jgi:hypothetical protein